MEEFKLLTYPEVYSKLCFETAIVVFMKKDESIRIMLCTRNMPTIRLKYGMQSQVLAGHDRRCSISNGNLAVFDLVAGDARQFNIDRLTSYNSLGVISTMEELERAYEHFNNFVKLYNDSNE